MDWIRNRQTGAEWEVSEEMADQKLTEMTDGDNPEPVYELIADPTVVEEKLPPDNDSDKQKPSNKKEA